MIYPYACDTCEVKTEIVKSMHDSSRIEKCSTCNTVLRRIYTTFQTIGTSVQNAEFNHGLGCVVKNKYHREELAKQRGFVEVGNDFGSGEKMQQHFEKRKQEEKEKIWEDPKSFEI